MTSLTCDPENVIQLWTRTGPCEIQLLSGDITQLSLEDKVDIIMVSAFPGDYAPMSGTVIGALKKNLDINVRFLSFDRELDLRHNFSCWLSKPITTQGSPYRKLLCFERLRTRNYEDKSQSVILAMQIRDMFRVFVPVFNNQDNTVITPLLATGHQGHSHVEVCTTMVKAAAHWIEAGLPLRCFKIVIYSGVEGDIKSSFAELKKKLLARNLKMKDMIFNKRYDIYITFSPVDTSVVKTIQNDLKKEKSDIKVLAEKNVLQEDKVWQNDVFKAMVACKRIIAVLSQAFMQNSDCLEIYNMAMCCNRLFGMDMLVPFYIETVNNMPTYMGLVQWIDCRIRKEGDTAEGKLQLACSGIIQIIDNPDADIIQANTKALEGISEQKFLYDVFISYSHKTPTQAEALLNAFKDVDDKVKVFYDRSALTTGSNWQNMLYQCLGECRCVIALMSPSYVSSTVCMEEYNLAMARFLTKDKNLLFIPLCIEEIDDLPVYLSHIQMTDVLDNFDEVTKDVAVSVCDWLHGRHPDTGGFNTVEEPIDIDAIFAHYRTQQLNKQYKMVKGKGDPQFQRIVPLDLPAKTVGDIQKDDLKVDIALVYANDSMHLAGTLCAIIDQKHPGLNISTLTEGDHKRLEALDKSQKIVIFISEDFLKTDFHMQELHLALCRQRPSTDNIVYLIKTNNLSSRPYFPRILPYAVDCTDLIWKEHERLFGQAPLNKTVVSPNKDRFSTKMAHYICSYKQYFAMVKAAEDVVGSIMNERDERDPAYQILQNPAVVEILLNESTLPRFPASSFKKVTQSNSSQSTTDSKVHKEVKATGDQVEPQASDNNLTATSVNNAAVSSAPNTKSDAKSDSSPDTNSASNSENTVASKTNKKMKQTTGDVNDQSTTKTNANSAISEKTSKSCIVL